MAISNALYTLNTYTIDTETDLVPAEDNFTMASLVVTNKAVTTANVVINITDATNTELAVLTSIALGASDSKTIEFRSINVPGSTHKLRVSSDIAGVDFIASGVVIT